MLSIYDLRVLNTFYKNCIFYLCFSDRHDTFYFNGYSIFTSPTDLRYNAVYDEILYVTLTDFNYEGYTVRDVILALRSLNRNSLKPLNLKIHFNYPLKSENNWVWWSYFRFMGWTYTISRLDKYYKVSECTDDYIVCANGDTVQTKTMLDDLILFLENKSTVHIGMPCYKDIKNIEDFTGRFRDDKYGIIFKKTNYNGKMVGDGILTDASRLGIEITLIFDNNYEKPRVLRCHTTSDLLLYYVNKYDNVKELYEDYVFENTMSMIAGSGSTLDDDGVYSTIKGNGYSDTRNTVGKKTITIDTEYGFVHFSKYARAENFIDPLGGKVKPTITYSIKTGGLNKDTRKSGSMVDSTGVNNNILVKPYMLHSCNIVEGEISINMVCKVRLNTGTPCWAIVPLQLCQFNEVRTTWDSLSFVCLGGTLVISFGVLRRLVLHCDVDNMLRFNKKNLIFNKRKLDSNPDLSIPELNAKRLLYSVRVGGDFTDVLDTNNEI